MDLYRIWKCNVLGFFVCVEIMKILNVVLFKDSIVLSEAIKTQSFIEG